MSESNQTQSIALGLLGASVLSYALRPVEPRAAGKAVLAASRAG